MFPLPHILNIQEYVVGLCRYLMKSVSGVVYLTGTKQQTKFSMSDGCSGSVASMWCQAWFSGMTSTLENEISQKPGILFSVAKTQIAVQINSSQICSFRFPANSSRLVPNKRDNPDWSPPAIRCICIQAAWHCLLPLALSCTDILLLLCGGL